MYKKNIIWLNTYLTRSSKNITFVQQPRNVPPIANGTFIFDIELSVFFDILLNIYLFQLTQI